MPKRMQIRRVKSREERKSPSVFLRLKTDEYFRAHALFEPDPELDDNPGFYEFYRHWDQQANTYVPCTGDSCPYCMANDNPWPAALSLWYFPDNEKREQLKIFTLNNKTTEDMSDTSEEESGVIGKKFRVKRMSDKGDYKVTPSSDKPLTKKQIETLLDGAPDLEEIVLKDAKRGLEKAEAVHALMDTEEDEDEEDVDVEDEDDEDEEVETPKARRGRPKKVEEEDEDEEEESAHEDIDEQELELLRVSKAKNTVTVEWEDEEVILRATGDEDVDVSDFKKGDTAIVTAVYSENDEEWTLMDIQPVEEEEADEEEDEDEDEDSEDTMSDVEVSIVSTHEDDEFVTVKGGPDGAEEFDLWSSEGIDIDYDSLKKGTKVIVSADKDDEGDWVATAFEIKKAPARRGTSTRRRASSKK